MAREKQDEKSTPDITSQLAHPIYLDTPMLISFLAAVDDGVSFSSEVAERVADTRKSSGEGSGEAKVPGLAALLGLTLSASGKYGREKTADQSMENKFVRQHTAASLFNRLRFRLSQQGAIKSISEGSAADLLSLSPGDLISVSGVVEISPLQVIVKTFNDLLPFFDQDESSLPRLPNRGQRRNLNPEEQAELSQAEQLRAAAAQQRKQLAETKKIVELVERDIQSSPIVDLVLRANGISALVTASRESFTDEISAVLVGGTFTLLGKVTAVSIDPEAETDVVRRGAMGILARDAILPMLELAGKPPEEGGIGLQVPDAVVRGRHLQVIPLAIYV